MPPQQQEHISEQNNPVKGIQELVDAGLTDVPRSYIRPVEERPCLSLVSDEEEVPIIDLTGFYGENRERVIQEIGHACEEWGFFQVIGHGVTPSVIENFWTATIGFFQQPPEEKMRLLSEDIRSEVSYITSHNRTKEKVAEWKDTLYFRRLSGAFNGFEQAPEMCREPVLEYMKEITILANAIYEAIFLSLGLSSDYLQKTLPEFQRTVLGVNYYPPCPDPELTFGISSHSDITCLTILMQNDVPGLQVMKNGKWVALKPVPGSFVINLGDQTEILSNGKYRSIEHRAVTNSDKTRMSVPCFFSPSEDARIGPLSNLLDEKYNPALYRETRFGDYLNNFYSKPLARKDAVRICCIKSSHNWQRTELC